MFTRCLTERLQRLLGVMPAVYLQGARQTGKTTLAKQLLEAGVLRDYVSFDDPLVRTAAQRDPVSFVRSLQVGTAIDEAQLVPEVMPVLKMRIDESRAAGMFLLTGSASPLAHAQVADARVGRMVALQLLPLSQAELAGSAVNWVAQAFAEPTISARYPDSADLTARLTRGGYPVAVALDDSNTRAEWLRSYADALITRDLQTLGGVERQDAVLTLLRLLAANPCATANIAGLSRETGVAQATLSRYLSLLTNLFVAHPVPAWYANLGKRLLKAPKLMLNDTGLAVALAGFGETRLEREPTYAANCWRTSSGWNCSSTSTAATRRRACITCARTKASRWTSCWSRRRANWSAWRSSVAVPCTQTTFAGCAGYRVRFPNGFGWAWCSTQARGACRWARGCGQSR